MDLKKIRQKIIKALRKKDSYVPEMEFAVDVLAIPLLSLYKTGYDVEGLTTSWAESVTREGNVKVELHPSIKGQPSLVGAVIKAMVMLGLNWSDLADKNSDDKLQNLIDDIEND